MTHANFTVRPDGVFAVTDPDVERFIDGLSAGEAVESLLDQHLADTPNCKEVSSLFWRALAQRIWDMLEANGRYDQETFDSLVRQGADQERWKTQRWKRRAKAYKRALKAANVRVPEVEDPARSPAPTGVVMAVRVDGGLFGGLGEETDAEHELQPDDRPDIGPVEGRHEEARLEVPPPWGPDPRGREGDGAPEGGADPSSGDD